MVPQDFPYGVPVSTTYGIGPGQGGYQYQFIVPGVQSNMQSFANTSHVVPQWVPVQQQHHTPVAQMQVLPPGTVAVCAPMGFPDHPAHMGYSDHPVHIHSAATASHPASARPLSVRSSTSMPPTGGVWADAAAYSGVRRGHMMSAAAGQATSVEDVLQLVRSLPRGSSVIAVVADSLRYLDSRALAALLKELSKTGLREVAFEIFDWLRSLNEDMHPEYVGLLDVFTYTTMIAQCTNQVYLPVALELISEMRTRSIPLNTHTYSSMLNVCVKVGELELALDVFNQMLNEGLLPNLVTYNTLLEVYAKRGMWAEAVGVLDTLEQQRLVPEPRTYSIVMNACNAAMQFASCISVYSRMARQKVVPTVGTYNAVILAHCQMDQLPAAQKLFDKMQQEGCQPTHTTFITLLQSAEAHGHAGIAVALLDQMQATSLRLTPQCYAAAIGACVAAGELPAARKLLGNMLASSKAGMAAPAHIIIQLQDKCCDWQGAYRTYQKVLASGVRPDSQTTAMAIDALWSAGNISSCLLALQTFENACQQGVFRLAVLVQAAQSAVEFSLPVSGTCMALISLWRLLVELRGRVSRDGPGILRSSVVVLLGDGQVMPLHLQDALAQLCRVPGMPFTMEHTPKKPLALIASAGELARWLLGEHLLAMSPVMPAASDVLTLQEQALLEAESAAVARSRQRLLQALECENRLEHSTQSWPPHYQRARPKIWQQLQTACSAMQLTLHQLPHNALVLLDQAASAGLMPQPEGTSGATAAVRGQVPLTSLLAACVLVAGQAAVVNGAMDGATLSGHVAPQEQAVAVQFGITVEELLLSTSRLREGCGPACYAPVSAMTFLDIYLEALCAGQLEQQVAVGSLMGDAFALAGHAITSNYSSGLLASQLAPVVVVASRQRRGLYPAWPKILAVLTGLMKPMIDKHEHLVHELIMQGSVQN